MSCWRLTDGGGGWRREGRRRAISDENQSSGLMQMSKRGEEKRMGWKKKRGTLDEETAARGGSFPRRLLASARAPMKMAVRARPHGAGARREMIAASGAEQAGEGEGEGARGPYLLHIPTTTSRLPCMTTPSHTEPYESTNPNGARNGGPDIKLHPSRKRLVVEIITMRTFGKLLGAYDFLCGVL